MRHQRLLLTHKRRLLQASEAPSLFCSGFAQCECLEYCFQGSQICVRILHILAARRLCWRPRWPSAQSSARIPAALWREDPAHWELNRLPTESPLVALQDTKWSDYYYCLDCKHVEHVRLSKTRTYLSAFGSHRGSQGLPGRYDATGTWYGCIRLIYLNLMRKRDCRMTVDDLLLAQAGFRTEIQSLFCCASATMLLQRSPHLRRSSKAMCITHS